jgi:serine/threonine protein kinase
VQAGTKLGRYEIVGAIGKGGMGEVYLARDPSVGRHVAIKLLPEELVADADRLQRLRREARVLASLNHPNIAGLYAFEEENGRPFLVLEFVEGETLAARLSRGPVPMRNTLQIGVQIADALAAVHERGVVHRDLKPSNVMLTPQGGVKLLDFGVARRDSVDASADTESHDFLTTRGQFVGTPAYMSPEQARGSSADQQSDIWAYGCVLYELLTRKHPFPAPSRSDQIAAILEREPDWAAIETVPPKLRDVIKRCLRKEPARRFHHIADARIEIQEVLEEPGPSTPPPLLSAINWRIVGGGIAALALMAVGLMTRLPPRPEVLPEPVRRFTMDLENNLAFNIDYPASVAISGQGDRLAYVIDSGAKKQIYVRTMDEVRARPVDGTEGAQLPFFSPDGRWLGFFADGKLKKVSLRGGAPIALGVAPNGAGGAWSSEGWIVYAPSDFSGLRRVSDSGGEGEAFSRLNVPAGEQAHWSPIVLADQHTVLFTVHTGGRNTESRLAIQRSAQGDHQVVLEGGSHGRVLSRWLIYARGTELLAVEFELSRGQITGTPFRVLEGVQDTPAFGAPVFAVSDQGTLVYAPLVSAVHDGRIVWLDRAGNVREEIESGHASYRPRLSPDGNHIVFHFFDPDLNLWVRDLARGTRRKLTRTQGWDAFGVWSPDGSQIAFSSAREGARTLFLTAADGSGTAERLLAPGNARWPTSWSPDGQWLAFHEEDPRTGLDLWLLNMRDRRAEPLLNTPAREAWGRFSPDGQWIAYYSDETGVPEVYVRSVKDPVRTLQVSTGGGTVPIWSRAGDQIYYNRGTQFVAVPVRLARPTAIGRPQPLFAIDLLEVNDTNARGDLFLGVDAPRSVAISRFEVVLGWPQVLARLAQTR